jgi:YhgE/Pip-like protein
MSESGSSPREPARATDVFKLRAIWLPPVVIVVALVFVMTLVYFGSVVDPSAHLYGLPVALVNSDAGARIGSRRVDLGRQVATALTQAPAVTDRLSVRETTLRAAKDRMDRGKEYVTVVVPPGFTASTLARSGAIPPAGRAPPPSPVELLTTLAPARWESTSAWESCSLRCKRSHGRSGATSSQPVGAIRQAQSPPTRWRLPSSPTGRCRRTRRSG